MKKDKEKYEVVEVDGVPTIKGYDAHKLDHKTAEELIKEHKRNKKSKIDKSILKPMHQRYNDAETDEERKRIERRINAARNLLKKK